MSPEAVQYRSKNQVGFLLIDYPPVNVLAAHRFVPASSAASRRRSPMRACGRS